MDYEFAAKCYVKFQSNPDFLKQITSHFKVTYHIRTQELQTNGILELFVIINKSRELWRGNFGVWTCCRLAGLS